LLALLLVLSAACSMVQPTGAALGTEQHPVKLALAPSTETQQAIGAGDALARLLERETGLRVKLSVPTSYSATVEAMGTHNLDVAWLGPLAYVLARERVGASVLVVGVRDGRTTSAGQIVVRSDSGIAELAELRGKQIAFADEASVAGYRMPLGVIADGGFDPSGFFSEMAFVGSDVQVLSDVYARRVEAGAIVGQGAASIEAKARRAVPPLPADLVEQIRVVAQTDPVPNEAIGIRGGVPPEVARKLQDGLLRVAATPAGAAALRDLYAFEGLTPIADSAYAPVRTMAQALKLNLDTALAPRRPAARP
jgi:phosphonate transport system substrate-binding protein